jgi:hypothetical protein
MQNQIRYLKNTEIDKKRWDECISASVNRKIYAFSWYLDIVAKGWDAVVMDNYLAVMPLPNKKKFGLKQIYAPLYTQQLGIFYLDKEPAVEDFLTAIPMEFRFIQVKMNSRNHQSKDASIDNKNYILSIANSYNEIKKNYNRNCSRNIKKAIDAGLKIRENLKEEEFIRFFKMHLKDQMELITRKDLEILKELILVSLENKSGELIGIDDLNGTLQAIGFFLKDNERITFVVCGSTKSGKKNQSMYMLVDYQIRKYAGKFELYDFMGSNLKGVAYFNSTFGSEAELYQTIKINRLPWILKILKK